MIPQGRLVFVFTARDVKDAGRIAAFGAVGGVSPQALLLTPAHS
jgi:hypothetical protein